MGRLEGRHAHEGFEACGVLLREVADVGLYRGELGI